MKIGAAYIRVSTDNQLDLSPESQLKEIIKYSKGKDIILPKEFIFIDEGISGRYAKKRPEFMKMINIAKTKPKPFDIILLWKFSRFARNREDSIVYKSMLRKDCGIEVVSITEQIAEDPTSILIEALLEAMDEYYSVNLAQEVKRGMNEKFSRGGIVNAPPFGYKIGKDCYEVDEEAALIVNMIFNDFINGMSIRQIAIKLNSMGVCTNRGNAFENRTVEYILSNPVYIGKLRRNLSGNKCDRFYRGEGVTLIEGKHKSIIEFKVFETVQNMFINLKEKNSKCARNTYADFMLRGLLRCSNCKSTLTQSVKGKTLQCYKYARGKCNKSHSISLLKINNVIIDQIQEDMDKNELDIYIKSVKKCEDKNILKTLINRENEKLKKIKLAYENEIDTIDEYKISKIKILKRIKQLKNQASELSNNENISRKRFKKSFKDIINKFKSSNLTENEKNEILISFISKIVFDRDKNTIQIYYYI